MIHPEAIEICNGLDDDCDGILDSDAADRQILYVDNDGDDVGISTQSILSCEDEEGYTANNQFFDCDDNNPFVYP